MILFGFSDDASQPYTAGTATQIAFTNGNAVANYYDEESRGAVTVTGQVFGWYQIPSSKATCDPFTWATQAKAAATAAGVNLAAFTNYVYAFPKANSCGWAGLGAMPGKDSWNNGAFALRVVAHELGHNFGVHHASSLSCTSGTTPGGDLGDLLVVGVRRPVLGDGQRQLRPQQRRPSRPVRLAARERDPDGRSGWPVRARITAGRTGRQRPPPPSRPPQRDVALSRRPIDPRAVLRRLQLDGRRGQGRHGPDLAGPAESGYGLSQTQLVDTTPATSTYADAPLAVGAALLTDRSPG